MPTDQLLRQLVKIPANGLNQLAGIPTSSSNDTDINNMIIMVNEELVSLNLGFEGWVESRNPEILFGFAKLDTGDTAAWQLAVREEEYDKAYEPTGAFSYMPLLWASRDVRIEGLGRVPVLLTCLQHHAKKRNPEM